MSQAEEFGKAEGDVPGGRVSGIRDAESHPCSHRPGTSTNSRISIEPKEKPDE